MFKVFNQFNKDIKKIKKSFYNKRLYLLSIDKPKVYLKL